jgi:hypothetical protein
MQEAIRLTMIVLIVGLLVTLGVVWGANLISKHYMPGRCMSIDNQIVCIINLDE